MGDFNNPYTVRQCSKCQENTEYFCESCLNCIPKHQEICYTHHNKVIGECCKPCNQIRKTMNIIKTEVIFHRRALLAETKSDVKNCKTLFSLFQSDTIKKSEKLKNLVESNLCDIIIKHRCFNQNIRMNKLLHIIQSYEQLYEQSAMTPVQFLLSRNKNRFNKLKTIHHLRQHSLLLMSKSPCKKALTDTLVEFQFKEGGKRCLQKDALLNHTFKITDADVCKHISCVSSDKTCVSDYYNNLVLIHSAGETIHKLKNEKNDFLLGFHTAGCKRDIFFIDKDFNIMKWSYEMNATTIVINKTDINLSWRPECVNWSASTETLLVGMHNKYTMTGKVTLYDRTGTLTKIITPGWFKKPGCIIQNNNGDVVVSDIGLPGAVVGTGHGGRHRFSYRGRLSGLNFLPRGICADALCNILICDEETHTVQMIDMNGQFLLHLLKRPSGILAPYSLTYNMHTHLLWVGSMNNNRVCVYRFITNVDDLTEKGTPQKKEQRRTNHEKYVSTFELHLSFKLKDIRNCHHISYVTSKSVWVSNNKSNLILTNVYGEAEKNLKDVYSGYYIGYGLHTVNREKELFYIDKNHNIWKEPLAQNTTSFVFIKNTDPEWRPQCVHCSLITGDLLVGMYHVHTSTGDVTRYNNSGQLILTAQHDNTGLEIYRYPNYVIENNNGDVVVSDLNAVVVTDRGGKYLFTYTGHPPGSGLKPRGICTDTNSHILVCDRRTSSIEIIDKEGQFLTHLLEDRVNIPHSLCYDVNNHNLWVGYENTNEMCVYRYNLQKAALDDAHPPRETVRLLYTRVSNMDTDFD